MRRHAKASSAVSTTHRGSGLGGAVRGAFDTRDASRGADGSGAPSHARARVTALLLAVAALALLALAPTASASTRLLKSSFGNFSGDSPRGLAVDQQNGDVYAINFDNNSLDRYNSSGNPKNFTCGASCGGATVSGNQITGLPLGVFDKDLAHVAIDRSPGPANGDIYVADGGGAVEVFDNTGALLTTLTGAAVPGGAFGYAVGVAVDQSNGDLFITDIGAQLVYRYTPHSSTVADTATDYAGAISPGIAPADVAAGDGAVYVGDTYLSYTTVDRFNASDFTTGSPNSPTPTPLSGTTHPTAISVDPSTDDVYVDEGNQVHVFNSAGTSLYSFGSGDFGTGTTASWSSGVAVMGNKGDAYVADPVAHKIRVYPLITRLYKSSFGNFSGDSPRGLAVDQQNGDVYAINFDNNSLDRYNSSGNPKNFTCGASCGGATVSGNQITGLPLGVFDKDLAHVAIDRSPGPANGDIYVADGGGAVEVFDNTGALLTTLTGAAVPGGAFGYAVGVAVDQSNGDLFITDIGAQLVYRYTPHSSTVADTATDYAGAISPGIAPADVAAGDGAVYVGDTYLSYTTVDRFNASDFTTGSPNSPTPTPLSGTTHPTAISVDPSTDDVYVDEGNQVHVFNSAGTSLYSFGSGDFGTGTTASWSSGVAVMGNKGDAYVADPVAHKIRVYPLITRLYKSSFGNFSGDSPRGLAVDQQNGDVYAINFDNNSLDRYNSSGNPKNFTCGASCGGATVSGNQITGLPLGVFDKDLAHVAIDRSPGPANGDIYVADGGGAVEVFDNTGALLTTLTGAAVPGGAFGYAVGVAVDQSNGDLFITDIGAQLVYRYTPHSSTVADTATDYAGAISPGIAPADVAAGDGAVYVGDTYLSYTTVDRFNASDFTTGSPNSPTPTPLSGTTHPTAISVDPSTDDVYVDEGNQVHVFNSAGTSLYSFGSGDFGTGTTASWSSGVAVMGNKGDAYVADPVAHKIRVYGPFAGETATPPPTVTTQSATAISLVAATLNASVNPHGGTVSDCHFEYVDDAAYQDNLNNSVDAFTGAQTPSCTSSPGGGNTAVDVSADITGLTAATTYHFRAVATNATATVNGGPVTFTTDPLAFTDAATAIHHTDATLNGHFDPQGVGAYDVTGCHFDWLSAADYAANGNSYSGPNTPGTVSCVQNSFPYSAATPVTANLPGLHPGTTYHFRLHLDTTSGGEQTGADQSFATTGFPVVADPPSNIHHTDLTLNGSFDSQGDPALNVTDCHFDWGTTTAYNDGSLPCDPSGPYDVNSVANVSAFLNNLTPGITYHYRLRLDTAGAGGVTSDEQTGDRTVTMPLFITSAPSQAGTFGPSGDNTTSFASGPGSLAFDNGNHRLYAAGSAGVYGFNASAPPTFTPVSGFNPLATAGTTSIAVDNSATGSAGRLYALDAGNNNKLYAYSSSGSPLGSPFPLDLTANPDFLSGSHGCGVGVDSTGRIWVSDPTSANNAPILRYSSSGVVQSSITSFFPCQLAFNSVDDLYIGRAGGQLTERRDAPGYASRTTVDNHTSVQIAVDRSNNIAYVAEGTGNVAAYDTTNTHLFDFNDGVSGSQLRGIAVDPSNGYAYVSDIADHKIHVFAPGISQTPPTITQQPPTNVAGDSVTLNAKVDPETFQVTDCHFEVVPDSQFQNDGFAGVTAAQKHACSPDMTATNDPANSGSGDVVVHADVSGLNGGSTYHTRIVAANNQPGGTATGTDQSFTTNGPRVTGTNASSISDTAATLGASVNPESADTTYQFQYTTDADFQANGFTNAPQVAPANPSDIGNGAVAVPVHEDLSGLDPDTAYRFRIVAQSPDGTVDGPDVGFHTYLPNHTFGSCPNDALRTGAGANLPDCRAYEQASPVDKNGAHALTSQDFAQAAADGNGVTFAGLSGLPVGSGANQSYPVVARRTATGWTTRSPIPVVEAKGSTTSAVTLAGLDPNLTTSYSLDAYDLNGGSRFYVGDLAAGGFASPFSRAGGMSEHTVIAGFTADPAHVLVSSQSDLAFGGIAGKPNLYDYDHGSLHLADRVPVAPATSCNDQGGPACVVPADGAFAGGDSAVGINTQPNLISADGSRIFFTDAGSGNLFMRVDGARTVQLNAPAPGAPADPNGHKPATFAAANKTGSLVYFTSCEKLTADSTAVSTAADSCSDLSGSGGNVQRLQSSDLYRYDTATGQLTDLSVDNTDAQGADVEAVLGASADGSWVYFAARGSLAAGAPAGDCKPGQLASGQTYTPYGTGSCGVYVSHDGGPPAYMTSLPISQLPIGARNDSLFQEWRSVVADDGTIVFEGAAQLTSYDNTGPCNSNFDGPGRCVEIYRYRPGDPALTCVSCNPTGAAPVGAAATSPYDPSAVWAIGGDWGIFPRTVSADGNRVFFQTPDKLLAADTNGDAGCSVSRNAYGQPNHGLYDCNDVYEWEADGSGSCHSSDQNGGCIYLLTSGTSSDPSWIVDASTSGDDVFIRTTDQLVPQDTDSAYDVYDVRVDGGLASQHQAQAPPCGSADQCHGQGTAAPSQQGAGTGVIQGQGNPKLVRCAANKVKRHGRCVAKPHKRKHHKKHKKRKHHKKAHRRHHARSHRRAGSNRGGSK